MNVQKTKIDGLLIVQPSVFHDERGYFFESYNARSYGALGLPDFVQDNQSYSKKNVVRALHFQLPPFAQGKLVRVIKGCVLDVAVDLRLDSPTFGQHIAIELSDSNQTQFWIPAGFAHGFSTLSDEAIFSYKTTEFYNKDHECGIRWNDGDLAIDWKVKDAIVAQKDAHNRTFKEIAELLRHKKVLQWAP